MSKTDNGDGFDAWLMAHPRQALQLSWLIFVAVWQVPVAFMGLVLFLLLVRVLRLPWWWVLGGGVTVAGLTLLVLEWHRHFGARLGDLLSQGMAVNGDFVRLLFQDAGAALIYGYDVLLPFVVGFSLLVAGVLALLELVSNSQHEQELRALQRGQAVKGDWAPGNEQSLGLRRLDGVLGRLSGATMAGTLLGVSQVTGQTVVVPDATVNQMVLVLGTTGGGKTVTLRRFYERAMQAGYPLIIVDGKPTDENVAWVRERAEALGRTFYGFNCGSRHHYDCLAQGGYTELKDKIISLKDTWESDYYRSIAEDYLQTAFEVLIKSGEAFDLKTVVACLDYEELAVRVRGIGDRALMARVQRLEAYDRKDITGLQAHLNLLIHSELGHYFERDASMFSLTQVIQQQGVVYFALPALSFPRFATVLGKLVINDIKAVVGRLSVPRLFTVFDEFSVFAGEQVLNLVNMGRGKGVHAIFGTQGLADLQKVEPAFANQVLNCVNTIICHRLNDQESAEAIAGWIGTRDSFDLTAQISSGQGSTGMGSVRRNKAFIVHPDAIKQSLQPGEAFYVTKVGRFLQDKLKIHYS